MEWSTLFKTKPVVQISETLKSGVFFIYLSNKKKKTKPVSLGRVCGFSHVETLKN